MAEYQLTRAAERDLLDIARYTIKTWGVEQAIRYEDALKRHFRAFGRDEANLRPFIEHRPDLLFVRCEHHYVFLHKRKSLCPLIIALFHKNMDLMTRLRDRLELAGEA